MDPVHVSTSYYAMLRSLPEGSVPVAVSIQIPSWFRGCQYRPLAPTSEILSKYHATGDTESFTREYKDTVLRRLDPHKVVEDIVELAGCHDIVLMCYEKPSDFCHRHLIAEWLKEHSILCDELVYGQKGKGQSQTGAEYAQICFW